MAGASDNFPLLNVPYTHMVVHPPLLNEPCGQCAVRAVHYVGRLVASDAEGDRLGEVFMDSRSESNARQPVFAVAGRGEKVRLH